jgi:hypothetical protein
MEKIENEVSELNSFDEKIYEELMTRILVIAVLGRKNEDVYEQRIMHAFNLIKNHHNVFTKIHLIAKDYNNKHNYEYINQHVSNLNLELNNKIVYENDRKTKFFRKGLYSFDTIEEAAMLRLSLENLFANKQIYLCVVTSDFHSTRSDWIINNLYSNLLVYNKLKAQIISCPLNDYGYVYLNPCQNSETEIKEKMADTEQEKLSRQKKNLHKFNNNYFEYYKNRKITFKGKFDETGKNFFISLINK